MARLPSKRDILVLCQQMRRRRIKLLMALHVLVLYWLFVIRKRQLRLLREPCRYDPESRSKNLNDIIYESDILCIQQLRMDRRCFWTHCSLVTEIGGLRDTRNVKVEEMVAMFLHVLAYDEMSRSIRTDYQRSQETISRHFNNVLRAVLKLWRVLLKRPQPIKENEPEERWKWLKPSNGRGAIRLSKRRDKRIWTAEEEKILTDVLYEMNDSGWKVDTGHRSGYLTFIEKELDKRLPNAHIKADPHIQSKVKSLKKLLSYVLDVQQNGSGFGWDDERKMVVGDKSLFLGWAKSRPGASALYGKPFLNFDKLFEIYASDLAKGMKAKGPGDQLEEHEELSSGNVTEPSQQHDNNVVHSHSQAACHGSNPSSGIKSGAGRKRVYLDDGVLTSEFSNISKTLKTLVESETASAAALNVLQSAFTQELEAQKQTAERRDGLFAVLQKYTEFSRDQIVKAALITGEDEKRLSLFYSTPDDLKSEFVRQVLKRSKKISK